MSQLQWYWHRLRAMSPDEMAGHARKKFFQFADARRQPDWTAVTLESSGSFPKLPKPEDAPEVLREALKRDVENILAGRWKAFGHLEIKVDDPPLWHCDYLVGKNLATTESAFKLNHRDLPDGADIKLIWELSRWQQLVRLAMAAYVLGDDRAAGKCVAWLADWVKHNPPWRGWNWTSALEVGMRLVQFTWIDALLGSRIAMSARTEDGDDTRTRLSALRQQVLPAHLWYTWRYKSFGSSANNHLIGELAGLILATARWPALAEWGAPLDELQRRWEHEVLAQFAEDGGNREQALNYQLFSWEFCWQARMALLAAERKVSPPVDDRLDRAARFFWEVQARREPWDYGDSDSAFVTPLFSSDQNLICEWRDWLSRRAPSPTLDYWFPDSLAFTPPLGFGEPSHTAKVGDWWLYKQTGIAVYESGLWWLRWDLSPLGYLRTAAHGHLDALQLSIWFKGVAMVIDPGTGAYYANPQIRTWLASRPAHNGPCPTGIDYPTRVGPFLWSAHHLVPVVKHCWPCTVGVLNLPGCQLQRRLDCSSFALTWVVEDSCTLENGSGGEFVVRWQFAPGTWIKVLAPRKFSVNRADASIVVEVDENWIESRLVEAEGDRAGDAPLAGLVSSAFRKTCFAPYLLLKAPGGDKPCLFRTTFLASGPS